MMIWLALIVSFGFLAFLTGISVFMHFESRKFCDNQFTVKLLPPPMPRESSLSS